MAQISCISDKGNVFVGRGFLIRFFAMAIQAHLVVKHPVILDLVMRIQRLIPFGRMTTIAEIRSPGVGRPPQGKPVEPALDALPIHIMAGLACEFAVPQGKAGRHGQLPVRILVYFKRVAVSGRQAAMAPAAKQLVIAIVFQTGIAPFDRCAFMALPAIFSGKMNIGPLIDNRAPCCRLRCLQDRLPGR